MPDGKHHCDGCENETMTTLFHKALGWDCKECQAECECAGCEGEKNENA